MRLTKLTAPLAALGVSVFLLPAVQALAGTMHSSAKEGDSTLKADASEPVPTVDLLKGLRSGQVAVTAEGTGDGRMALTVKNRSRSKLRVVLPPGLVAVSSTGQMMGGMGGMGGGMGGMGGGMGGMGGMGGGMRGGMGGMGGGMMGSRTMPPMMGMMMLSRIITRFVKPGSWDAMSAMGGMGGMGGMMGGMGGMMSVPPVGPSFTELEPQEKKTLPTRLVSLGKPDANGKIQLAARGETLRIGDISQLNDDPRVQAALKRLATDKAPTTVAQLVLWNVAEDIDWETLARITKSWANVHELALAQRFVEDLDRSLAVAHEETGVIYFDVTADRPANEPLARELRQLLEGKIVLGLKVKLDAPTQPEGPSVRCRIKFVGTGGKVEGYGEVAISDGHRSGFLPRGWFKLPLPRSKTGALEPKEMALTLTEGILNRLVRVQVTKGPRVNGHPSFRIQIKNDSSLLLNGVELAGRARSSDQPASVLDDFSLPPHRTLSVPASAKAVERLGLKEGVRIVAADLAGL